MTATDELRHILDERGVEWRERVWGGKHSVTTFWHARGVRWHYRENRFGELRLHADGLTPAQAVEATLGRGTCRDVRSTDHTIAFECSECGCWVAYDEYWETGIYVLHETGQEHIHPHYCPSCGAEVVDE